MFNGIDFYNEQLAYVNSGDIDGLMDEHFHDEAELVTFEFIATGKQAIRKYLTVDSPAQMGRVLGVRTVNFMSTDDVIIFVTEVNSEKMGYFQARDAFYLKDGKILRFMSLTLPPGEDQKLELGHVPDSK